MSVHEWIAEVAGAVSEADAVVSVTRLHQGEVNETFRVILASGQDLVIRRCPEHVADWHATVRGQVAAMDLAREVGVPVPEVVYAEGRVLAYRFVRGASLAGGATSPELAREAGTVHGRLYNVRGDGLGPVQPDGRSPGWTAEVVFGGVAAWADRLRAASGLGPISRTDVDAAVGLLETRPPVEARLLHGDASPGNTIVDANAVAALIDFDDACFGDPAGDAAWWWWNDPATSDHFDLGSAETYRPQEAATLWLYRLRLLLGLADTFASSHPLRARKISELLPLALHRTREALIG